MKRVLIAFAAILTIGVAGCTGPSGDVSNLSVELAPATEDGWFAGDGSEEFDGTEDWITAGDSDSDVISGDVTDEGDDGVGEDPVPTSGDMDIDIRPPAVTSFGTLPFVGGRSHPRITAKPLEDADDSIPSTGDPLPADDNVVEGYPTAHGAAGGGTVDGSGDDEGDEDRVAGPEVSDSEIAGIEIRLWTGHDDAARLKKSKAWFQFCTDRTLRTCSEKFRLNETNDDFQGSGIATISLPLGHFADYFAGGSSIREMTQYFRINLEKKNKDGWELQGLQLTYVKQTGERELAYFNPCVHKWLGKNASLYFGPDDTAICAIVETHVEDNKGNFPVLLKLDGLIGAASASGSNTSNKGNPHIRISKGDFYMAISGHDSFEAGSIRSYGDWSFDSNPFERVISSASIGDDGEVMTTETREGAESIGFAVQTYDNCNHKKWGHVCAAQGWRLARIAAVVYKPAQNFRLGVSGDSEIVMLSDSVSIADTVERSDIPEDEGIYYDSHSMRYPEEEDEFVTFSSKSSFIWDAYGFDTIGIAEIGGIDLLREIEE